MRYGKIRVQAGGFFNQIIAAAPAYSSSDDEGRLLYAQDLDQLHYGCDRADIEDYVRLFDSVHDMIPNIDGTYTIGDGTYKYLGIYADTFYGDLVGDFTGNVSGNVSGDLTGDIYCANGTDKILENGSTLLNADGYWAGDLMCIDGVTKLMDNKSTPGAVTFLGNAASATKAKYA